MRGLSDPETPDGSVYHAHDMSRRSHEDPVRRRPGGAAMWAWLAVILVLGCDDADSPASGSNPGTAPVSADPSDDGGPAGARATPPSTPDDGGASAIVSPIETSIQPSIESLNDPPSDGGPTPDAGSRSARVEPMTLLEEMRTLGIQRGRRGRAERFHSRALAAHKRSRYKEAESLWAEAARRDPAWERPFYNLACATAQQQRHGDALAYLRMVARRQIDYRRLRKVETDPDLQSIRKRPELREVIELLSEQLLVGSYRSRDGKLFSGSSRGSRCKTFTLDPHGQYSHGCKAKYATAGEWAYAGGILYFQVKSFQKDCDDESCPSVAVNDHDALAITKLDDRYLCLERVAPERKWPVDRDLGETVSAPQGTIVEGCYE